jgi:CheY-like chemotaxis protein
MARTILLADDSLTIQKVVELTFMDQDYRVLSVGDGRTALMRWAESPVDLVIADVHMPGVDGYEVCRQIKSQRPDAPVLLLVGTFEPFDEGRAAASGADGHLKKPFDSQELLRLVDRLLSERPPAITAPLPTPASAPVHAPRTFEAPVAEAPAPSPIAELSTPATATPALVNETSTGGLSDDDVDRVAKRVVQLLTDQAVRDIAWEVVPDLAELVIKERIRELEAQVE